MKRNDIQALHDLTGAELQLKLNQLVKDFTRLRMERRAGKLSNTASVPRLADDIARVETILAEKKTV